VTGDKTHNQGPLTQDDLDDLFVVHLAQARKDNDALDAAMEAVRAVRKVRTRNRTVCRTDGFPLTELDNILADELLPRHEVEDREAQRLRMRGVAGQPGGSTEQPDLFKDSFAKRERDEAYWRGQGYTAGLRGLDQDPNKYDVPQEQHQAWLEDWHAGQKRLATAWETKARIESGGAPPPPPPPEDEEKPAERPAGTTDEEWEATTPKPQEDEGAPAVTDPKPEGEGGAEAETPAEQPEPEPA
jgi:hypothetical protein